MLASRNPSRAFLYRALLLTQCIDNRKPLWPCRWNPLEIVPRPQPVSVPASAPMAASEAKQHPVAKSASRPHSSALATALGIIGLLTMPSYPETLSISPILPIVLRPVSPPPPTSPAPTATRHAHARVAVRAPQPKPARSTTHHATRQQRIKLAATHAPHVLRASSPPPLKSRQTDARPQTGSLRPVSPPIDYASFNTMPQPYTAPPAMRPVKTRPQVDWMSQLTQRRITEDRRFLP